MGNDPVDGSADGEFLAGQRRLVSREPGIRVLSSTSLPASSYAYATRDISVFRELETRSIGLPMPSYSVTVDESEAISSSCALMGNAPSP
jgi:hypothetical protein